MAGRYLMVLRVPGHRCGPDAFEIESAFAEHLRMLRRKLGPLAETLVLAAPELSAAQRAPLTLARVEAREGIVFRGLCPAGLGRLAYLRRLRSVLAALREEVERADVVHAGLSDPFRPLEFPALVMARRRGKPTISVTDIDNRHSARMRYRTGQWSLRQYLSSRLVYDGAEHLQQLYAVRRFSLVLLKGAALAADYGRGRSNVKNFLDSAFEAEQIIPPARLEVKVRDAADAERPLRAIYFGRLVPYKGVDHMLRAVRAALDLGARVELQVVGEGEARPALEALAAELRLERQVSFAGALPFGALLFERLYDAQVLLAAPLAEDTPRSALDACAAGEALLAYDTYYYRELAQAGAPVELVPWRDHAAMGRRLLELDRDRPRLAAHLRAARAFAVPNTQEAWLDRRVEWTKALFE